MTRSRLRIRVEGVVQGVGYRPFVRALAAGHALGGFVGNDAAGVFVEAEGSAEGLASFVDALRADAPPLAVVEGIVVEAMAPTGESHFVIAPSPAVDTVRTLVASDAATCGDCVAEIFDPSARRFRYAFTSCTACGPRFSILRAVPYDRANTTMSAFPMCADCAREYHDPNDRRSHAEANCCPACGPRLAMTDTTGARIGGDPVSRATAALRAGRIVAIKGLGGYHLACDAASAEAVRALRARKRRPDRPFALMVADLDDARRIAEVSAVEARLLSGHSAAIVLVATRDASIGDAVAPGTRRLGVMLPYTPLHHLMMRDLARPVVLTSGNAAGEPIAFRDVDARARLATIADFFLTHDRPIHTPADDSVVVGFRGAPMPVRRSRGLAPGSVVLPIPARGVIAGLGAELKSTICVAKDARAVMSAHIGDLEDAGTYRAFNDALRHLSRLFDAAPDLVAHDLHPDYLSTRVAETMDGVTLSPVQHHHAHVASCLAEHGETGPVIGVAFDGLGLGDDGTLWGGEILVADLWSFARVAHIPTVRMPGGAAAIREPWRMAAAWIDAVFGDEAPPLAVAERNRLRWDDIIQIARKQIASPPTSSAGRLFDAVAAIAGVRDRITYEGQAAVELERIVARDERGTYPMPALDAAVLVRAVVDDVARGVGAPVIAARFHNGVAAGVVAACEAAAGNAGVDVVALSGGVFQNMILLDRVVEGLERSGLRVLVHRQVPPNDGGISLGQVAIAAARDRGR